MQDSGNAAPIPPSNSGNERKTASCQRDQGWYVRLIAYSILAGSERPLEEIGTVGIKEMYNNLEIPIRNIAECMRCLKEEAMSLMSEEDACRSSSLLRPHHSFIVVISILRNILLNFDLKELVHARRYYYVDQFLRYPGQIPGRCLFRPFAKLLSQR